jgi:hypothetical protein
MKTRFAALVIVPVLTPLAATAQPAATPPATPAPMTILSQSSEYRFQLDFHVNDAALAKMLPTGWVSNAATQGAAKDANIRLIFIDATNIVGPDNRVLGKGKDVLVYIAAPVKQADGAGTGQMILGGISLNNPDMAFGVMDKASDAKVARTASTANDMTLVSEDWDIAAASGAHAMLHVQYLSGPANKGGGAVNFYNPADPSQLQIFRSEQATDITRNATTNPPDRVQEFSYKASGGKFAALFDGTEKPLSWDSQPVYTRVVGVPAKQ